MGSVFFYVIANTVSCDINFCHLIATLFQGDAGKMLVCRVLKQLEAFHLKQGTSAERSINYMRLHICAFINLLQIIYTIRAVCVLTVAGIFLNSNRSEDTKGKRHGVKSFFTAQQCSVP
jgi:hypothetical protein